VYLCAARGWCFAIDERKLRLLIRFENVQKILAVTVLHVAKLLFVVRSGPNYVATYMT